MMGSERDSPKNWLIRLLRRFLGAAQIALTAHLHDTGMAESTLTGRRLTGKRRAPKAVAGRRVCSSPKCDTVMSRYNKKTTCYTHSPVKFPRVRGREVPTPS